MVQFWMDFITFSQQDKPSIDDDFERSHESDYALWKRSKPSNSSQYGCSKIEPVPEFTRLQPYSLIQQCLCFYQDKNTSNNHNATGKNIHEFFGYCIL